MLKKAKQKKVVDDAESLIVFAMVFAIIGARIAYIIINPSEFPSFLSLFEIWKGGMISWGFLIGGILGAFIFKASKKMKKEKFLYLLDLMSPYLILAIAIGRIGCFLRGCCFGIPSDLPWAVNYGNGGVHPTQIYHSIADFLIFIFLLKMQKKKDKIKEKKMKSKYSILNLSGSTFMLFLMLYSLERFFIDFLRYHPAGEYIGKITITQIIFLVIFAASVFFIKKEKEKENS
jgi:phosphatidylglycerol:prolipoprotein diacylglycerol transferase